MAQSLQTIRWERFPLVATTEHARTWLSIQVGLGRAANTVEAYGRALEDFLAFCGRSLLGYEVATREQIAAYVQDLITRPNLHGAKLTEHATHVGLANATLQQRLTVVRLLYDYLIEEGLRADNPVGRGRYTPGAAFGGYRARALLPRYQKLPWIPSDDQWRALLTATQHESLRNRVMFAFAYDAALRRQELCSLLTSDLDPALRLIHIRAETTKNLCEHVVPYSEATSLLYAAYLRERHTLSDRRGSLFLSQSPRNRTQPITMWTWSKVVQTIAARAAVPQFSTHTLRHLRLTDLARANWDIHEIAVFAGHRSIQSTLIYIHLSGRDLSAKLARGMATIHAWRTQMLAELLEKESGDA